jgi:PIN domain
VLVSELSRSEDVLRSLLLHPALERFYIAEYVWEEAQHELPKRFERMVRGGRFSQDVADRILAAAMRTVTSGIYRIVEEAYVTYQDDAHRRIPDDPNDWHTVALAMVTGTAIWTMNQRHFWGCGIAVWSTPVLRAVLSTLP